MDCEGGGKGKVHGEQWDKLLTPGDGGANHDDSVGWQRQELKVLKKNESV